MEKGEKRGENASEAEGEAGHRAYGASYGVGGYEVEESDTGSEEGGRGQGREAQGMQSAATYRSRKAEASSFRFFFR
jgi:hypothetical protein